MGYHPRQPKVALIELDPRDAGADVARLERISEDGGLEEVLARRPARWGEFLRYRYLRLDFSDVTRPGMYVLAYRGARSAPFRIAADVYRRDVWQPTLEYFLPVQMCHVRVEEQYRVWHGAGHLDDARMAPPETHHFDGYQQGPATLTAYAGGESVPGLNAGGWHDAGDDDLRIESQADEVWTLASIYELFGLDYDATTVDEGLRLVRIHRPDGRPDVLQQVEHGLLTILGGYRSLGRLYRGIIVPTLPQYVMLGDLLNSTDDLAYDARLAPDARTATTSGRPDDRLVFTEENPAHEYQGIAALAIAGRVLRGYDPALAGESLDAAQALWRQERDPAAALEERVLAAVELLLSTGRPEYRDAILELREPILQHVAPGRLGARPRASPAARARLRARAARRRRRATSPGCEPRRRRPPTAFPTSR